MHHYKVLLSKKTFTVLVATVITLLFLISLRVHYHTLELKSLGNDVNTTSQNNVESTGKSLERFNVSETEDNNHTIGETQDKNRTKLIVVHCSSSKDCDPIPDEGTAKFKRCKWSNCEITGNQDRIPEATVVFFRRNDPYPEWPKVRFANQTYIHVMSERPCRELWWLAKYDGMINLTWNYRYDADISLHIVVEEKRIPDQGKYVPRIPFSNKTRSVVWAVSHCNADSRRDEYVAELSKYIDVDIYGKCGTLQCAQHLQNECADMWEQKYKFYLAFENAICKDYVTEKLFRTLNREMIPVVLGGADYSVASPPMSCISVRAYKSPKELAMYLHRLAQNEEEYNAYFQWKQRYILNLPFSDHCKLCEIAHNMEKWSNPAYRDYYQWYMNACDNDLIGKMRKEGNW